MLAGIVGPATNWRLPFVVMAVPSLTLAVLLVATTREPPRGGDDGVPGLHAAPAAETTHAHQLLIRHSTAARSSQHS